MQNDFGIVDNADNVLYQLQKKKPCGRRSRSESLGNASLLHRFDSKSVYQSSLPHFELNRSKEEKLLRSYERVKFT